MSRTMTLLFWSTVPQPKKVHAAKSFRYFRHDGQQNIFLALF